MDLKSTLKKAGISALILLIGFFAVMAFFSPLLGGKEIIQHDIDSHKGMSKEANDYREATGEEPLWTTSMFGGMPTYQISQVNSGNMIATANNVFVRGLWIQIGYMFLMFAGMFFLLNVLKVNPWVAAAGALAYTFGSYFYTAIEAGHNSKLNTMAYVAPLIGSVIMTYRGKLAMGIGLTALFAAFMISNNHYQVSYYAGFALLFLGITEFVAVFLPGHPEQGKDMKPMSKRVITFMLASFGLVLAGGLGAATDTARLWETAEYSKWSIRGGKSELTAPPSNTATLEKKGGVSLDYLTQWSYGIDETFTLLIPNFKGGPSTFDFGKQSNVYETVKDMTGSNDQAKSFARNGPGYWGEQPFTSGPIYAGAIICYLFLLGLFIVPGRYKWWALATVIFTVMLSWGKNLMPLTEFMYRFVPMYNKFRAPTQILMFTCLVMTAIGMMAVQRVLTMTPEERKKFSRPFLYITAVPVVLLVFFALMGPSMFDFMSSADKSRFEGADPRIVDAIIADRADFLRMDSLRSLFFVLVTAGVLSFPIFFQKVKVPAAILGIVLFLVAGLDLIPVAGRYINGDSYRKRANPKTLVPLRSADQTIKSVEKDIHYRVWHQSPQMFNDAQTSFHHKSIGGYFPVKSRRYQELFDSLVFSPNGVNMEVLRMLNTKWVIKDNPKTGDNTAMQFPAPCGNAWFVENFVVAPNADEEIVEMRTFKADSTAIIPNAYAAHVQGFRITPDSMATIKLTTYSPRKLTYEYKAATEQLAVFSEIHYHPGWNAFIDGQPAEHIRANYVLRAMRVPAGSHNIEFRFEPDAYVKGNSYSRMASLALILILAGAFGGSIFMQVRASKRTETSQE